MDELYNLSIQLGIIPQGFSKENFEERFFYLFIERNTDSEHGFNQGAFKDEGSKNYDLHMKDAFLKLFSLLEKDRSAKLSLATLNAFHDTAYMRVEDAKKLKFRERKCTSSFYTHDTTAEFLESIAPSMSAKLNLLPDQEVGKYGLDKEDQSLMHLVYPKIKAEDAVTVMSLLIENYYQQLTKINQNEQLSKTELDLAKTNLIGLLVSDLIKYHPYADGNGRVFCFLTLNYLLIQQELPPCMIFHPWVFAHATPKEVTNSIIEGQEAFKTYFLQGKEVDTKKPITDETKNLFLAEPNREKIISGLAGLFITYAKVYALKNGVVGKRSQAEIKEEVVAQNQNIKSGLDELSPHYAEIKKLGEFGLIDQESNLYKEINALILIGFLSYQCQDKLDENQIEQDLAKANAELADAKDDEKEEKVQKLLHTLDIVTGKMNKIIESEGLLEKRRELFSAFSKGKERDIVTFDETINVKQTTSVITFSDADNFIEGCKKTFLVNPKAESLISSATQSQGASV